MNQVPRASVTVQREESQFKSFLRSVRVGMASAPQSSVYI
jgi:hypothetical protein